MLILIGWDWPAYLNEVLLEALAEVAVVRVELYDPDPVVRPEEGEESLG